MAFSPGDIIDEKYRIVRLIGEGGMGYVYEGMNLRIKRRVAIKVLNADIAASSDMKRRFEREAQVAAKIGSPHICDVLDLGDLPSGESYLVMEFLEGEGLDSRIDRSLDGRVPPPELSVLCYQMLEGLAAMHEAGIIHRDIKPANAFIARSSAAANAREVVKLLDFGISKFQNDEAAKHVTQTGALLGTPVYMSPEQARGERTVDNRSDIYSVGVILYRAITGRLPFEGDNFQQLLFKIALEPAPPLAELAPEVDEGFRAIIDKAMAKSPDDRYATAREMQEALVAWDRSQGRTSLQFRAAVQGVLSSEVISAAAAVTSSRKAGLDEKSAPVAWGNPSAPDLKAVTARSDGQTGGAAKANLGASAEAKTPPPAGSDATLVDAAMISQRSDPLAAAKDADAAKAAPAPADKAPAASARKSGAPIPIIAAAAVVLLVGSFVGYKQFGKPSDPAGTSGTTQGDVGRLTGVTQPAAPATQAAPVVDPASAQVGLTPSAPATAPAPSSSVAAEPMAVTAPARPVRQGNQARPNVTAVTTAPSAAVAVTPAASVATPATPATPASADPGKPGRKIRTEL